jgi:UDP-2-acetamido-3-amino-2,3-dideoxy-glucuronate N-acetyltransferase
MKKRPASAASSARAATSFVHPQALCESPRVGRGTRVWAFAHVLPGARIGRDCNLGDCVFVENDVVVGDRVTVKNGVQLWDGVRLGDDVFVGPNATFTNDPFPKSEVRLRTVVEAGASIGANATILPGLTIGRGAMVGAGAVVTKDVAPFALVLGNPARVAGDVRARRAAPTPAAGSRSRSGAGRR